jgi:hypothetical protein
MGFKRQKWVGGKKIIGSSSEGAELLGIILAELGAEISEPVVSEYHFHPIREWRADYSFLNRGILLEYEGLPSRFKKSRHTTREGYVKDIEKYNTAAEMGLVVLRYHWDSIEPSLVRSNVEKVLDRRPGDKRCATCGSVFCSFVAGGIAPVVAGDFQFLKCFFCQWKEKMAKKEHEEMKVLFSTSPQRVRLSESKSKPAIALRKNIKEQGNLLLASIFLEWGMWSKELLEGIDFEELRKIEEDERKLAWIEMKLTQVRAMINEKIN